MVVGCGNIGCAGATASTSSWPSGCAGATASRCSGGSTGSTGGTGGRRLQATADGTAAAQIRRLRRYDGCAGATMPLSAGKRPNPDIQFSKRAQKPRFCAREVGKLASGSVIAETLSVNVAFLQITAHASKIQIPHNQIINFYQRAR